MAKSKNTAALIFIGGIIVFGIIFFCCFGGILVSIAVPGFVKAREQSRLRACQENQLKVDSAVRQYMMNNNITDFGMTPFVDKPVTASDLGFFFSEDGYIIEPPVCPSRGDYYFYPTSEGGYAGETIYCTHDANGDGVADHPFPY